MSWNQLGALTPTLETWRTLNAPTAGDLFRLSQAWAGSYPGKGAIQLRLLYANQVSYEDAYFEIKRLYPNPDERLIYLPFNPVMAAAGYSVRYFQARLSPWARIQTAANWTLTIDEWTGATPDPDTLDGGEY